MKFTPEQLIVSRLLLAVRGCGSIALGEGIPRLLQPHLPEATRLVPFDKMLNGDREVEVAVVDPIEVSSAGDVVLAQGSWSRNIRPRSWIAAMRQTGDEGRSKLVERCSLAVSLPGVVRVIITELGVIEIGETGFVLRELAPGVSSDDVRRQVRSSLHVADDIDTMLLSA